MCQAVTLTIDILDILGVQPYKCGQWQVGLAGSRHMTETLGVEVACSFKSAPTKQICTKNSLPVYPS